MGFHFKRRRREAEDGSGIKWKGEVEAAKRIRMRVEHFNEILLEFCSNFRVIPALWCPFPSNKRKRELPIRK